jgi:hypothetical protein
VAPCTYFRRQNGLIAFVYIVLIAVHQKQLIEIKDMLMGCFKLSVCEHPIFYSDADWASNPVE